MCWRRWRPNRSRDDASLTDDDTQRHRGTEEFDNAIVLVRHGKSIEPMATMIRGRELGQWVAGFNQAGITRTPTPSAAVQELVTSAGCVLASDLKRSLESARVLSPSRHIVIDQDLREADLPSSMGVALPLPVGMWIVIARMAWW